MSHLKTDAQSLESTNKDVVKVKSTEQHAKRKQDTMASKSVPADHPALDGYSMEDLKAVCPAFQKGPNSSTTSASASTGGTGECPFANLQSPAQRKDLSQCPAFSQGCPFKGVRTVDELYRIFSTMPEQHAGEIGAAGGILQQMLHGVHQRSAELAKEHGACPVFSNE